MTKDYAGNGLYHVTLESTGISIELSEADMNEIAENSPIFESLMSVQQAYIILKQITEDKEIGANEIYEKVEELDKILC